MMWSDTPRGEMAPERLLSVRRREKELRWLRASGRSANVMPEEAEEARAKMTAYHSAGMTYQAMADQTGLSRFVFGDTVRGANGLRRASYEAVMAMTLEVPAIHRTYGGGATIPALGSMRRLHALRTLGFSWNFMGDWLGITSQSLKCLAKNVTGVRYTTAMRVAEMYDKLKYADPRDYGVSACSITRTKAYSAGKPGPSCWDDDTIDSPDAFPEWTGKCGTVQGVRVHAREHIPVCEECSAARQLYRLWPKLAYLMGVAHEGRLGVSRNA